MPAMHRRRWTLRDVKRLVDERPGYTPRYELVDGDAELFDIWHPDDERPALVSGSFIWNSVGATEPLLVDVARFFADAADTPLGDD